MQQFLQKHFFVIVFGIIGGAFLLFGLLFVSIGSATQRNADQLENIPVLDLVGLGQAAAGAEVALEGKISERNPFEIRPFVAYLSQRYEGERCRDDPNDDDNIRSCEAVWTQAERATPPLWLDLPEGRIRLTNTDYQVHYPPFSQQSTTELIEDETKAYQGFRIGDPVFAIGQVVSEAEGPALKAQVVAGGTHQSYLARSRSEASNFTLIGGVFALIGVVLIAFPFVWRLLSRRR